MEKKMYEAKQIAEWFVQRAGQDINKGGEYLTQLKLQKLLYYAQGFFMALNNGQKLFSDEIYHLQYGPAVKKLMKLLKPFGNNPIPTLNIKLPQFDDDTLAVLELVYQKLGQYSAYKLVELTHNETPWLNSKQGKIISSEDIYSFFKTEYIQA